MTSQSTQGLDRTRGRPRLTPRTHASPTSPPTSSHGRGATSRKRSIREFRDDQCTDLAAALTYYAVLAIFPAALALTALLGLVGQAREVGRKPSSMCSSRWCPSRRWAPSRPVLEDLASSETAGLGPGGRSRARALVRLGVRRRLRPGDEPDLRDRRGPAVLEAPPDHAADHPGRRGAGGLVLLMLIVSGPLAKSIGDVVGLGDETVQLWDIVKWPIIVLVVIVIVALLYYATPNVQQPKFRWISVGATVAIVIWIWPRSASPSTSPTSRRTTRPTGRWPGWSSALIFLWLTNVALLLGAEIDSELERGRQLQAGIWQPSVSCSCRRGTLATSRRPRSRKTKDAAAGREIRRAAEKSKRHHEESEGESS